MSARPLLFLLCLALLAALPVRAELGHRGPGLLAAATGFLPVDAAYRPTAWLSEDGRLRIDWQIAEGYYLYRHAFRAVDPASGGELALTLPAGIDRHDAFFGDVEVYYDTLSLHVTLPDTAPRQLALTYQGCADAGLCYAPETRHWQIDARQGVVTPVTVRPPDRPAAAASVAGPGLWMALLLAFAGGLILNLMPCVFPVLGLKLLSLAQTPHRQAIRHSLAYGLGVLLSFWLIASLLLLLRSGGSAIGWGFHLQSPTVIAGLAWLFTGIGLSLSGVFTPGFHWLGIGQRLTEGQGSRAAFFTGVLAVVVASPCTAPFMAAALGFALVQPAALTLTVFTALGAGMATPLVLLGLSPALARRLPRPGPWMERLKHWLALPIYATVAWLLWVLHNQVGPAGLIAVLAGCLLLALACWLFEHHRRRSHGPALLLLAFLLLAASLAPLSAIDSRSTLPPRTGQDGSNPWSPARLAALRAAGAPVFLNVTADWCITCLANERIALDTEATRSLFAEHGITYLKADWTRHDPAIAALLAEFGRSGVPLYVYYPGTAGAAGQVLPQFLTPAILKAAIGTDKTP